jgi:glucose/mannose transport system permease protein
MTAKSLTLGRVFTYGLLLVAALFFLAPLYVMIVTSFKDADQLRAGNLLSLPTSLNLDAWHLAWNTACTGVDCRGLKPYFWNSVVMAVPAVLISTAWGAINGYVLSMWKFRGSEVLFGFLLSACSCRSRWCCCP